MRSEGDQVFRSDRSRRECVPRFSDNNARELQICRLYILSQTFRNIPRLTRPRFFSSRYVLLVRITCHLALAPDYTKLYRK